MQVQLFIEYTKSTDDRGVTITRYCINPEIIKKYPHFELQINSIDMNTGEVQKQKIIEFSKHEPLIMYKISSKNNLFKDFWLSEDHSIIGYDIEKDVIRKITPKALILNPLRYYLIYHKKNSDSITWTIKNKTLQNKDSRLLFNLQQNNCELLSTSDYDIVLDESKTIGYDFTVAHTNTFEAEDGLMLKNTDGDTVAVYALFTKEAINEAKQKMNPLHSKSTYQDVGKNNNMIYGITLDAISSIYEATRV